MRPPASDSTRVDCWNTIGVRGDASCPELTQYIHCHNCPVHSAAALAFLDREPPRDYALASTAHFAIPKPVPTLDTQSVVVFRIAEEWLALPTSVITEIGNLRQIHSLPQRHVPLLGVANVHGELIVCVSLAHVLGVGVGDSNIRNHRGQVATRARLMMIRREDVRAACPVDEIDGIHHVQPRHLQSPPATVARSASAYAKHLLSWREHSVGLLDDQLLFCTLKRSLA